MSDVKEATLEQAMRDVIRFLEENEQYGDDWSGVIQTFHSYLESGQHELLAKYQAAMVNVCRELGCEPNVAIAAPEYYEDMATEAIMNLRAEKAPADPKGRIPIAEFDRCALLYRPENTYQPFVVAYGYDKDTGEWSHGSYYGDLGHAFDEANPEIIEDATVRWELEDIRAKLEEYGIEASDHNIAEVLGGDIYTKPIAKCMKENMIQSGHEDLESHISYLKEKECFEAKSPQMQKDDKGYSLSSEQRDASAAKEALGANRSIVPERNEER